MRWRHPDGRLIPPDQFIPVAEDTGLIVPLGQWVLRESCAMLARWRHEDPASAPQSISVNVSPAFTAPIVVAGAVDMFMRAYAVR